jgi:hypothetical protein
LEVYAQQQLSLPSAPAQDAQSTVPERATVSISQTPDLDGSSTSKVEYVKHMPFGLEKTDVNSLQGLGRVFDPYHGGEDMYMYSRFLTQRSPVVVSFVDNDTDVWTAYGSLYEHNDNGFVTLVLHSDTQYPSIELLIKRENGSTASCRIFANSLKLINNIPQVESYSGNDTRLDRLDLVKTIFTRDFYKRPNIGQIEITLLSRGSSNNHPALEDHRPIWTGDLTEHEISDITTRYNNTAFFRNSLSTFSKPDAVIARLNNNNNMKITISRALEGYDHHRCFDESMIHFKNCLQMCSTFGNLWFYTQLAGEYGLDGNKKIWADAPRPYWLANEWAIERNNDGEIIKATPSKWSKFRHPGIFPDKKTAALMQELDGLDVFVSSTHGT